jgi:hypothetical protein
MFILPPARDTIKEAFNTSDMANRIQNMEFLSDYDKELYLKLAFESFYDGVQYASRLANINSALIEQRLNDEETEKFHRGY